MIKRVEVNNLNFFKKYLTTDIHLNSKMYKNGNNLYKFPHRIENDFISTMEYIDEKDINGLVKITSFINDNKNNIVGYTMKNLKHYKSLSKNKKRNFKKKIKDCLKVIDLVDELNNNNLIYHDYHTGNVLLNSKNNDIKICDIDSFEISNSSRLKESQMQKALELCVAYLYNVHPVEAEIVIEHSYRVDQNGYFRDCVSNIGTKRFKEKVMQLEKLNKKDYQSDRRKIKEDAKDYIKSGYYRYY